MVYASPVFDVACPTELWVQHGAPYCTIVVSYILIVYGLLVLYTSSTPVLSTLVSGKIVLEYYSTPVHILE